MIALVHPLVRKVRQEYDVLRNLVADIPVMYERQTSELEKRAEEDAKSASDGDYDIYSTVYHSYDSTIEFLSEMPTQVSCYMLAAIYAFYERNVKELYRILNVKSRKVYPQVSFPNCNLSVEQNQKLFEQIDMIHLVRDNQAHGVLNTEDEMQRLKDFVNKYHGLQMIDNVVFHQR